MSFRLLPKSVTLNDLERRNGRYFALLHRTRVRYHRKTITSVSKSTFYSAPQCSHCKRCTSYGNSVRLSVRLSVCPSVTRRYFVKTTARSTVQFALSDSIMCLVL